jgi:hypothetical protein
MSSNGGAHLPIESQAPTVKGVMWTMSMVPLVFVLMRLYVRVYMRRVFGWDDGIAIAAIVRVSSLFVTVGLEMILLTSIP